MVNSLFGKLVLLWMISTHYVVKIKCELENSQWIPMDQRFFIYKDKQLEYISQLTNNNIYKDSSLILAL